MVGYNLNEAVAVDETKLKVNGRHVYVWIAIDVKTKEIITVSVSIGRSSFDAYLFLKSVRGKCLNRAKLYTDKGPWYNKWTCRMFEHIREKFGRRNPIEQWFSLLKKRTRGFYNNINCKNIDNGIIRYNEWISAYAVLYNFMIGLS